MSRQKIERMLKFFFPLVEERLFANDHKSGWRDCTDDYLLRKLGEEFVELIQVVIRAEEAGGASTKAMYARQVMQEAADVAAVAGMIAENWKD